LRQNNNINTRQPYLSYLYYVHDPMCSWCWAFRPVWQQLKRELGNQLVIKYQLGGLAPDTDEALSQELQDKLKAIWKNIQQQTQNTEFNYKYWDVCQPSRSTYPACRAVIAARKQGYIHEEAMILAIQQAYYLHAQNPSDDATLIALADTLNLNTKQFIQDLNSQQTQAQLIAELEQNRALNVDSFPSLVLSINNRPIPIQINYLDSEPMLKNIERLLPIAK
jgi:putative protein-disulfide isomerase